MIKTDYNCNKLFFCKPNKSIEKYYPGYTQEIQNFIKMAKNYCEVEILPMWDIWMRDFMQIPTDNKPVLFTYAPNYQQETESMMSQKGVQKRYPELKQNPIKLDGGHLVYNSKGIGFLTTAVMELNQLSQETLEKRIKKLTGLKKIIWLPWDKSDITGHTDGLIQFLTDDILLINDDSDKNSTTQKYYRNYLEILRKECPQIKIVPIPCEYDTRKRKNFPSCCGIYTNFVQVQKAIFIPAYGSKLDNEVLKIFQSLTNKPVIPIRIEKTAINGGSLHCLTRNF